MSLYTHNRYVLFNTGHTQTTQRLRRDTKRRMRQHRNALKLALCALLCVARSFVTGYRWRCFVHKALVDWINADCDKRTYVTKGVLSRRPYSTVAAGLDKLARPQIP
ncbi:hypothetical protein BaRGS_00021295 [Batillaria attramentaria]|uniref:Uncharacterized protein n=1 Tax=Batillaria attramentaria TaxID=370345 RepID=A0ABD0KJX6_9CAEN